MPSQSVLRGWLGAALLGCALLTNVAGCGGDDSGFAAAGDDGGIDVNSPDESGSGGDDATGYDADAAAKSEAAATRESAAADGPTGGDAAMGDATVVGDAANTGDVHAESGGDGGTDAGATSDADATMTGHPDAAADTDADAMAPNDAADGGDGSDGSVRCAADNKSCTLNGHAGLCEVHVCSQCVDPGDDPNCSTAYGGAYLCLSGTCTPGDCRTDGDCANSANGGICGLSRSNFCGKCTSDPQCAGVAGKPVCDTTTGKCAPGLCLRDGGSVIASNPPALCPVNASDICCATVCAPAAGTVPCCPEDPTDPNAIKYCTQKLGVGATCQSNVCTKCGAASNFNYVVDPNNGDDSIGTGASTAGCALKTITRALQVIPPNPLLPVTITVLGASTVKESNGEKFPITIPKGVTITTSGGTVTVNVPTIGFAMGAPNSALMGAAPSSLVISGINSTGSNGIVASLGSDATTQIANLDVTGFADDGIRVQGTSVLSIGSWVSSTKNGTATGSRSGLHVTDGHAIINPAANTVTRFDENTRHGIEVDGSGFVTLTGTVTDAVAGTGTVVVRANDNAGLWIAQTGNNPPQNVVSGLVSFASPHGPAGIEILAGSNLKLRSSVSLANAQAGVRVEVGSGSSTDAGAAASNDISMIDLGSAAEDGKNVFQASLGMNPNGGAGICLSMKANLGATLSARGNVFEANNCATTAAPLTANKVGCISLSGVLDLGFETVGIPDGGVPNAIDVLKCTHP